MRGNVYVASQPICTMSSSRRVSGIERVIIRRREYRQHDRQHVEQNSEWRSALYDESGLWPAEKSLHSWILDETEGPCRVR